MKQEDALSRLRVDLADTTKAIFTEDVLIRAVEKATSDLSRFLPLDKVSEYTLSFDIADEAWTSEAAAATYVTLANSPIKPQSETVVNNAGDTMVRDTDYTIKYREGKITHISGGDIGNSESCTISYTKSEIHLNISDVYSDMIRLERVEYPLGSVPQEFITYEQFKDVLMLKPGESNTQSQMSEGEHILIYYKGKHTSPTDDADSSYPDFLDDTVILVSSAYALFTQCVKYEMQSVADFTSARTALGTLAAIHTLTATALAKVTTYTGDMDTALDASIVQIAAAVTALTSIGAIHVLTDTALDNVATYVTDMDTALDAAIVQNEAAATALAKINSDSGRTYLTDADTALDAFVSAIADAPTALAKVDTYLAGGTESVKAFLAKITTDAAALRTAINTALDATNSALDGVSFTDIGTYLTAAGTALGKVATYLENNTNEDAKSWLTKITTDIAGLRTGLLTAVDAANTILDGLSFTDTDTYLGDANIALDKMITYLESNTNEDSKYWLTKLTTDIADLRTKALAALDAAAAALVDVSTEDLDKATTGAAAYLEAGDGLINTVNIGKDVPENYANYSTGMASIGSIRVSQANAYLQEASIRLGNFNTYISQAEGWGKVASGFATEAAQRIQLALGEISGEKAKIDQATAYLNEANVRSSNLRTYIEQAAGWANVAAGFVSEAIYRISMSTEAINIERTKIDQASGYIAEANMRITNTRAYIEQAATYGIISEGFVSEARERINTATAFISEASQRIAIADRYLSEASGRVTSANAYMSEANGRRSMTQAFVEEANGRMREIDLYLSEASNRVAYANAYIAEASGRRSMTQAFIDEANSRTYEMDRVIAEADHYTRVANQNLELANTIRTDAIERRDEGWSIWGSPHQYASLQSVSSLRQPLR